MKTESKAHENKSNGH